MTDRRPAAARDERAVSPVVGKALEAALVVLYLGMVTTALYGSAVPDYRAATGAELADRTLAETTQYVQQAVPPNATAVDVRRRVDLPATIAGEPYEIHADGGALVLTHPNPAIGGRSRLALPTAVDRVSGTWDSRQPATVSVESEGGRYVVRLDGGS